MMLGATSERKNSARPGTSCGSTLAASRLCAPAGGGTTDSSSGMAISVATPLKTSAAATNTSIRRAVAPARAALASWVMPSTSSAATSGMIVICKARSHSAPIGSLTGRIASATGLFAISDPASSPPTSPPKVHQIGRRNVTSRAGRVVSDADKPDLPLPSWMAGVQNARTSIQGSVETTGKGVKTSSWHASISAQTASGAKPTRAR